ncbi:MAG: aa3-type cytochrome c oxidase subunit IV [Pseudomonadota bacterium]
MASDYTRGEMDITDQENTWNGFMTASVWGSAITAVVLTYVTLTLAIGMNWMIALGICAILAVAGGMFMGMGGAWIGAVVAMTGVAIVVQIFIGLFNALL